MLVCVGCLLEQTAYICGLGIRGTSMITNLTGTCHRHCQGRQATKQVTL